MLFTEMIILCNQLSQEKAVYKPVKDQDCKIANKSISESSNYANYDLTWTRHQSADTDTSKYI